MLDEFNVSDREITKDEKNALCKSFYYLLPFILNKMTKRQREAITLKYGYNKKQSEISELLAISQSNVSVHLNLACKIIKEYFNIIFRATLFGLRYEKEKD